MKLIDLLVKELPKRGGWPDGADECYWHSGFSNVYFYNDGCDVECSPQLSTAGIHYNGDDEGESVTRAEYEAAIAKNDGWIEWGGGECPVCDGVMIDVRYRDMQEKTLPANEPINGRDATNQYWHHDDQINDIIAYRLHRDINSRADDDRLEQDLNECIGHGVDMPEWMGGGLPPVGTICEAKVPRPITGWEWRKVKVVESGIPGAEKEALVYDLETTSPSWADEFRPLRTEAEKVREDDIKAMLGVVTNYNKTDVIHAIEQLYDAGYRKEEK